MDQKNPDDLPLYLQAKAYLEERIAQMVPGDNRLEGENHLSTRLDMSRETVRKAMSTLIQEGAISRKHGKGNYGHPSVTNLTMRIDLNSDFRRILISKGYRVRAFRSAATIVAPSDNMLRRMPEARGSSIVSFNLDIHADGRLAIHGNVQLLQQMVQSIPPAAEYSENIDDCLREHCLTESNHTTAWLLAENNAVMADRFGLDSAVALLGWEEIYYNVYDIKMGYVRIYFNPEIMDLSLLLKF